MNNKNINININNSKENFIIYYILQEGIVYLEKIKEH